MHVMLICGSERKLFAVWSLYEKTNFTVSFNALAARPFCSCMGG